MPGVRHFVAVLAIVVGWSPLSSAAEFDETQAGSALDIDGSCAARVAIHVGSPGMVAIHATADHVEELAVLVFDTRGDGVVVKRRSPEMPCWRPAGSSHWTPTLILSINVPRSAAIAIRDDGVPAYAIDDVGGRLSLTLSGTATLRDAAVASFSAQLAGANTIIVGRADGQAAFDISGVSTIEIDDLQAGRLRINSSGRSGVAVKGGRVGDLEVNNVGAGTVSIGATVSRGSVSVVGAAAVRIARVTGPLHQEVVGGGTVTVGR